MSTFPETPGWEDRPVVWVIPFRTWFGLVRRSLLVRGYSR